MRLALVLLPLLLACASSNPSPDAGAASASLFGPGGFDWQGHRGARGLVPENTIPAFIRALDLGMTTLEMDAVITADSQVVVSHEPWMSAAICTRPDGAPVTEAEEREHNIFGMTYAEVARYDCGSRGNPRFPEQESQPVSKPLLSDVIAAAEAHARATGRPLPRYNIETKSTPGGDGVFHPEPEAFARLLYDAVRAGGITERATIQSFDPRTLRVAHRLDPDLSLALLVARGYSEGLEADLDALGFTPAIYSPDYTLVDADLVQAAHERGVQVIPWTVNDVDAMRRLIALGVDGIITDYPDRAGRVTSDE